MSTNIGKIDRTLRLLVGLAVLSLTIIGPQTMWGLLGLIPIATAAFGVCPAYSLFGLSTCAKRVGT